MLHLPKRAKWLEKHKNELEAVDITLHPPGKDRLKQILKISGKKITDLLNKSGEQYRSLNMKKRSKLSAKTNYWIFFQKNGRLINGL